MAGPPLLSYPAKDVLLDEPAFTPHVLERVEPKILSGECQEGYLYVERQGACDLLLLYKRGIHSAVRFQSGATTALTVADFFADLTKPGVKRMRLCRTDTGLVLLLAVVVQNPPTLKVPCNVADLNRVLAELNGTKKPAAIQIARDTERNLCYCRDGEPIVVYFADPKSTPADSSVRDKILAYSYAHPESTTLKVFHNLQSRLDENAGRRFKDLLSGNLGPPPFFLTVRQAGKVVVTPDQQRQGRRGARSRERDRARAPERQPSSLRHRLGERPLRRVRSRCREQDAREWRADHARRAASGRHDQCRRL